MIWSTPKAAMPYPTSARKTRRRFNSANSDTGSTTLTPALSLAHRPMTERHRRPCAAVGPHRRSVSKVYVTCGWDPLTVVRGRLVLSPRRPPPEWVHEGRVPGVRDMRHRTLPRDLDRTHGDRGFFLGGPGCCFRFRKAANFSSISGRRATRSGAPGAFQGRDVTSSEISSVRAMNHDENFSNACVFNSGW